MTLKGVAIYWVFGCLLSGAAIGARLNDCPNENTKVGKIAEMVATWPVIIGFAFTWNHKEIAACKP